MDNLRKIIRDLIKEESDLQMDFGDKDKARRGLIALSKGLIPSNEIKRIKGNLDETYRDEDGHYDEAGEVEIEYVFEHTKYDIVIAITGSYYYKAGWGGDYNNPPDHDTFEDEEITVDDDDFVLGDDERNEYEFHASELGPSFHKDMESFLVDYYDASESSIG